MEVLQAMHDVSSSSGATKKAVVIEDCGQIAWVSLLWQVMWLDASSSKLIQMI